MPQSRTRQVVAIPDALSLRWPSSISLICSVKSKYVFYDYSTTWPLYWYIEENPEKSRKFLLIIEPNTWCSHLTHPATVQVTYKLFSRLLGRYQCTYIVLLPDGIKFSSFGNFILVPSVNAKKATFANAVFTLWETDVRSLYFIAFVAFDATSVFFLLCHSFL